MRVDEDVPEMTPAEAIEIDARFGHPDGWMIEHHRAAGSSTLSFGPFSSIKEAHDWWRTVGRPEGISGGFIPLFKTVDWTR